MREAIGGFYGNFYLENLVKVSLFIIPAFAGCVKYFARQLILQFLRAAC